MLEDEGMVFTGLLVGLNVIDCNMCIKEEDLDQPVCTCTLKECTILNQFLILH